MTITVCWMLLQDVVKVRFRFIGYNAREAMSSRRRMTQLVRAQTADTTIAYSNPLATVIAGLGITVSVLWWSKMALYKMTL